MNFFTSWSSFQLTILNINQKPLIMRNFKIYLSFLAALALLFTSCSKDENPVANDSDKATLSFGAILEDLASKSSGKQSDLSDMPDCTDGVADYVAVHLTTQAGADILGSAADPFEIDLVDGQVFTEEIPELELEPGTYVLQHFSVYTEGGDLLWLAPKGGELADYVENPLPLTINLGAGVKKYVDVDVLCYDNRDVNAYGYLFFELDMNRAFEFCFFANYCNGDGIHYPARYSVDISIDGETLYSGVINTTGVNEWGDLYAEPLCFALPDIADYADDEEYIDFTLTLLDWEAEGAYGDVAQETITGSLSRNEILANHVSGTDEVEYEHFRFGCGDDDGGETPTDSDGDTIPDTTDNCDNVANQNQADFDEDGMGNACDPDDDNDGTPDTQDPCDFDAEDTCDDQASCTIDSAGSGCTQLTLTDWTVSTSGLGIGELPFIPLVMGEDAVGSIEFDFNEGVLTAHFDLNEGYTLTDAKIVLDEVYAEQNDPFSAPFPVCISDISDNEYTLSWDFTALGISADETTLFPLVVDFTANVCASAQ